MRRHRDRDKLVDQRLWATIQAKFPVRVARRLEEATDSDADDAFEERLNGKHFWL